MMWAQVKYFLQTSRNQYDYETHENKVISERTSCKTHEERQTHQNQHEHGSDFEDVNSSSTPDAAVSPPWMKDLLVKKREKLADIVIAAGGNRNHSQDNLPSSKSSESGRTSIRSGCGTGTGRPSPEATSSAFKYCISCKESQGDASQCSCCGSGFSGKKAVSDSNVKKAVSDFSGKKAVHLMSSSGKGNVIVPNVRSVSSSHLSSGLLSSGLITPQIIGGSRIGGAEACAHCECAQHQIHSSKSVHSCITHDRAIIRCTCCHANVTNSTSFNLVTFRKNQLLKRKDSEELRVSEPLQTVQCCELCHLSESTNENRRKSESSDNNNMHDQKLKEDFPIIFENEKFHHYEQLIGYNRPNSVNSSLLDSSASSNGNDGNDDNDENVENEYEYGPGIVDRLKLKFMSISIQQQANNIYNNKLTRCLSLENLANNKIIYQQQISNNHKFQANELLPLLAKSDSVEHRSNAVAGNATNGNHQKLYVEHENSRNIFNNNKFHVLKKAKSMETLSYQEDNNSDAGQTLNALFHRHLSLPENDINKSHNECHNELFINDNDNDNNNAVINEDSYRHRNNCQNDEKSNEKSVNKITSDLNNEQNQHNELPKPDTVKIYKRIFESSSNVLKSDESVKNALLKGNNEMNNKSKNNYKKVLQPANGVKRKPPVIRATSKNTTAKSSANSQQLKESLPSSPTPPPPPAPPLLSSSPNVRSSPPVVNGIKNSANQLTSTQKSPTQKSPIQKPPIAPKRLSLMNIKNNSPKNNSSKNNSSESNSSENNSSLTMTTSPPIKNNAQSNNNNEYANVLNIVTQKSAEILSNDILSSTEKQEKDIVFTATNTQQRVHATVNVILNQHNPSSSNCSVNDLSQHEVKAKKDAPSSCDNLSLTCKVNKPIANIKPFTHDNNFVMQDQIEFCDKNDVCDGYENNNNNNNNNNNCKNADESFINEKLSVINDESEKRGMNDCDPVLSPNRHLQQQNTCENTLKSKDEIDSSNAMHADNNLVENHPPVVDALKPSLLLLNSSSNESNKPLKSSLWSQPSKKSTNASTTVVFDFRGKDVKPNLAINPTPFGATGANRRGTKTSKDASNSVNGSCVDGDDDEDDNYTGSMDVPLPCGIVFAGENVRVGKGSLLSTRNKKLKLQFNDGATSTYEYPSEISLLEEVPISLLPSSSTTANKEFSGSEVKSNTNDSVILSATNNPPNATLSTLKTNLALGGSSGGGLANYKPTLLETMDSSFQLGVSRTPKSHQNSMNTTQIKPKTTVEAPEIEVDMLTPAHPEDTVSWSTSTTSDLLF